MSVVAATDYTPTFQWYKDGTLIDPNVDLNATITSTNAYDSELVLANTATTDRGQDDEPNACDELLKSLFDVYRIDKFETTFDVSIGANRLNDWYRGCAIRAASDPTSKLPEATRKLFSGAQLALMSGDQYRTRDASHVRDCVLFSAVANRLMKSPQTAGQNELDRARAAFDHVVATLQLQLRHSADLPFTPYELYLLGKGTANDRAWLFVNTLRALRIDSVLLIPANAEDPGMTGDVSGKE